MAAPSPSSPSLCPRRLLGCCAAWRWSAGGRGAGESSCGAKTSTTGSAICPRARSPQSSFINRSCPRAASPCPVVAAVAAVAVAAVAALVSRCAIASTEIPPKRKALHEQTVPRSAHGSRTCCASKTRRRRMWRRQGRRGSARRSCISRLGGAPLQAPLPTSPSLLTLMTITSTQASTS